jgi:flagellar motor switch protein FliM
MRQVCQVTVKEISQRTYEEYVNALDAQTLLVPLDLPPVSGTGVLQLSLPVALASVDYMLGGPGGTQEARTLTDIETNLVRDLIEQVTETMVYAFEAIAPIRPSLGPIEYNPQFVQVVGATDAVVVALFDMSIGREKCELSLCLPLTPLLPKLQAQRAREDDAADDEVAHGEAQLVDAHVRTLPVGVSVEFAATRMSPTQALELAAGDIIPLSHHVGAPLAVKVGAVAYAAAVAGRSGKRLAALITETL